MLMIGRMIPPSAWMMWLGPYHTAKTQKTTFSEDREHGVTFAAIEESGVESFLEQIRDELVSNTYRPMRARKKEIPKDGGKKVRVLSIPTIRDRVVQGALKLILEPIFEADFQSGSFGYRPKRTAHQAVNRVAEAIVEKTRIIDIDLRAYLDTASYSPLVHESCPNSSGC